MSAHLHAALAEYRRQLAAQPDDVRTLLKLGDLHLTLDDAPEAVAIYARAVEIFANQGAHLKVIAVGKQVLQLVEERVPVEGKRIAEVVVRMMTSSVALGRAHEASDICRKGAELLERVGLLVEAAELRRRAVELGAAGDR